MSGNGASLSSGPDVSSAIKGSVCNPQFLERRSLAERDLKQGRPGGPAATRMKRVGRLAQQDDLRHAKRRRRADHRPDVFRVLKRDEQRAAIRPGIVVGPGRHRGHG